MARFDGGQPGVRARATARLIRMSGSLYPGIQLLMGLGAVIVLWLGGRMVVAGTITLGEFVAFGAYLAMLHWPMIALGWVVNIFERGEASMGRIARDPGRAPGDPRRRRRSPVADARGRGGVPRPRPSPTTDAPVLHDIDLEVPAGRHGGDRRAHRLRQEHAREPHPAALRPAAGHRARGRPRRARGCRSRRCAAPSASCPGDASSSRPRCGENMAFGLADGADASARVRLGGRGRPARQGRARLPAGLRDLRGRARASRSPAARSSARRWRARWPPTRASWSSTTRSPRSTPRPRRRSCAACAA